MLNNQVSVGHFSQFFQLTTFLDENGQIELFSDIENSFSTCGFCSKNRISQLSKNASCSHFKY
ncbi:hypothetical protein AW736_12120 [Termitidicoccus mucosus]|uniref:Uncharacterized protein n=1 Tax=Termitidicoccus mucosus TaxID=1184151 RepID=A0A178IKD6_9BACT|nr:hypothetical protein AW736_12120 [Opitutaceae bacterium TSB47]